MYTDESWMEVEHLMEVEIYHFNERTLDPWCCRVEQVVLTEREFEDMVKDFTYNELDDMYYSNDESTGIYVISWQ